VTYTHYLFFRKMMILIWLVNALFVKNLVQGIPAIPADSFVESIGINAHWSDPNIYTRNYTSLKEKLGESGIRYIRDGAHDGNYTVANDLHRSFGIKTNIVTGRRPSSPFPAPIDPSKVAVELSEIKRNGLSVVASLESPNEYDLEHGSDPDWIQTIQNFSALLYIQAKADDQLKHVPIIGPSLTTEQAYESVGDRDQYIDYANLHLYQGRRWPGYNESSNQGYGSITWFFNHLARHQTPSGKPIQATEAGYHNGFSNGSLSEEAEGKYIIRMYAEFFRRGIVRTYKYELVDEDNKHGQEAAFGILRSNMSEKPAFRAIKSLISILSDKGPIFTPNSLDFTLTGNINNTRDILFQKRDNDFYLMVWLEVPSWNLTTNIDLYPPPQEVMVNLQNNSSISSATLYTFNNTADMNTYILPIHNNQIVLNATDKISILKLTNKKKPSIISKC